MIARQTLKFKRMQAPELLRWNERGVGHGRHCEVEAGLVGKTTILHLGMDLTDQDLRTDDETGANLQECFVRLGLRTHPAGKGERRAHSYHRLPISCRARPESWYFGCQWRS